MDLSRRIGGKISRIIGADPDEVVIADSTSVNLFKLFVGALKYNAPRRKIITDNVNFPSDLYILKAAAEITGTDFEIISLPPTDEFSVNLDTFEEVIDEDTALVSLSHIMYKSSYMYDIASITKLAHRYGALMLWDFSHSVGAVPLNCQDDGVDLAVGSTYKYLNGGPGAPAFLYIRENLQSQLVNPLSGWFSHKEQFLFDLDYVPANNINRFLTGTPSIISLALIEPGVDLILEAGIDKIRKKAESQSEYMIELWEEILEPLGYALNSPREVSHRGSHVSFGHPDGYRIEQAVRDEKAVISDFRMPDNLRFGITPLYTTYEELYMAVRALEEITQSKSYEKYSTKITGVT
jgi:kynureninase